MRVIVVAPDMQLANVEDWVSSASGNEITVLNRTVVVREVLNCIANGRFQIIHFATHGSHDALAMSDGLIPARSLEDALRAAGSVEMVILGSCRSVGVGAVLYHGGVPRVLSWRDDVNDQIAGLWAREFYQSLRMSGDLFDATQTAGEAVRREGAEPPIYLNGRMVKLEAQIKDLQQPRGIAGVPTWLFVALCGYGVAMLALIARMAL